MVIGIFAHSDGFFQNPILQGAREAARKHQANLLIYGSPTMSNYSGLDSATVKLQYKVDRSELEGLILSLCSSGPYPVWTFALSRGASSNVNWQKY